MLKFTFILILILLNKNLNAQKEHFVFINDTNANITKLSFLKDIKSILASSSVFDQKDNKFIFIGQNYLSKTNIYCINASDGSISNVATYSVPIDDKLYELKFDDSLKNIICQYYSKSQQKFIITKINITTGTIQKLNTNLPNKYSIKSGVSTFDRANRNYVFMGKSIDSTDWKLFSVNIDNGQIQYDPIFPKNFPYNNNTNLIGEIKLNNNDNKLYGLYFKIDLKKSYFISSDVQSGNFTILDSFQNLKGYKAIPNYSTIDEKNNRFIFVGHDSLFNNKLYSIDCITGKIIANPNIQLSTNYSDTTLDNLIELHYSKISNKLFGLFWDSKFTSSIGKLKIPNKINIYPIPMLNVLIIKLEDDNILYKAKLYDISGTLKYESNYSIGELAIDRGNLSSGNYYVVIEFINGQIVQKAISIK